MLTVCVRVGENLTTQPSKYIRTAKPQEKGQPIKGKGGCSRQRWSRGGLCWWAGGRSGLCRCLDVGFRREEEARTIIRRCDRCERSFFFCVFIIIIIIVIGVAGFDWLNIGDCWRLEMDRLHAVW